MDTKQLAVLGGAVAATAKFYSDLKWKTALTLGVVAIVAAAVVDNIVPKSA